MEKLKDQSWSPEIPESPSDWTVKKTLHSIADILSTQKWISEWLKNQSKIIVPKSLQESVLSRMKRNYPALEMFSTLKNGSTFTSYIFTWIKAMNDNKPLWPSFVDSVLISFKEKFMGYCRESWIECQAVWDDYKNFVITPQTEWIDQETINLLMEEALNVKLLSTNIKREDIDWLWVIGESWIIEWELSQRENIMTSLAWVRMWLEKQHSGISLGYLDFYDSQVEKDKLLNSPDIQEETLHVWDGNEAEQYIIKWWKYIFKSIDHNFEYNIFDNEGNINKKLYSAFLNGEIPQSLDFHTLLSETIFSRNLSELGRESAIREVDGKLFEVYPWWDSENPWWFLEITDKNNFSQRVQIFNESDWFFNTAIITIVRKKKIPESMALYKKVKKILDMLVADWEFIFPHWENKWWITEETYISLKEKIENWEEVELDLLEKGCNWYYKWGLSKEGFAENIKDKTGQVFFIDIKDMWSINMRDFYLTLEKVRSWKITKQQAIIQSGWVMTEKFIKIIEKLDKKFWKRDLQYTIGWDEIMLFIEWYSRKTDSSEINSIITEEWIFGRITTSRYLWASSSNSSYELIEKLDAQTEYSKDIEELFWIIERRLIADERIIWSEIWKINTTKNLWNTNIFSKKEISDTMKKAAFNIQFDILSKMKSELQSLYDFYIEIDQNGNHNNDIIHFAGKGWSYAISEIFDLETKTLVPNSPFIDILRKKWLSREDRKQKTSD